MWSKEGEPHKRNLLEADNRPIVEKNKKREEKGTAFGGRGGQLRGPC